VCDPAADTPAFAPSGHRLPRARRSFGTAVLGEQMFLIGGLGDGFDHAGPGDVLDLAKGEWRELAAPVDWVSPQVAVIGDRLYVACGGTMKGQRFTEDRALWSYDAGNGWQCVIAELPFAVRHVQMQALRNRLLFYSVEDGEVVVRMLEPDASVQVPDAPFHR
jgi:hypothetical protein